MIGPLSSQLNAIKWGEFKLGDLFEVLSSKKIYHANTIKIHDTQIESSYPYVVRAATNNGIKGFIIDDPTFTNEKNTLSFAQDTFTVFYQKQPYFTGNKVKILKPKFAFKSPKILHFISAILQFILKPLTWGLGSTTESIAEFKFSLPLKPTANTQTLDGIDFDFMEKFIAELEQCRLAELQAYLKATGLENTTLSNEEENALNVFNGNNSGGGNTPCGLTWQSFRLGDLFEKLDLKFKKKIFNKQKDISKVQTSEFDLPLVNAKNGDNGIMYYGRSSDFESAEMTIDIVNDGAVSTANVYPQPLKTGVLYNAYLIKPKFTPTRETLLFFTPCIYKAIKLKFSYENKASWNKVKNELISLPLKPTAKTQTLKDIDFDFMCTLINALMKQTIQGVAQYCDAKIQATKEVISQETPIQKDSLF
ncbi:restriction endonuclease subunit S [Helicobacter pylori]|uniref:restriction endonuclease subunit S n=1 Tax=Helicobacter pylori TaxID=210 RepID=UPI00025AC5C8|nr:restriction endonuclease subunit S [Helicobacter pylori]EIE28430.1 type IIS R-M system restriction enzyme [Helicobacter pylori NCTC 11637 = CCUG 17874 = ATCC 43504 = JCM 12093]MBM0601847.1 restriction endonuclease subunit S [Helicobacter pylori]MBM0609368.1 restriction endonuclease subunit S [Helicobacter pylori]MBM0618543.1 restriction endonuclease subunit S [Helicobacter pylori]MBM0625701.1 restriction endonuclease subunit S [Helicobacter pylori]